MAGTLMIKNSTPHPKLPGLMVFFSGEPQQNNLRESAKLIIQAYNKPHLYEALSENDVFKT